MLLCEFSMFPLDRGESLSPYVARSLDVIDQSGLSYELHAMGTILEGEYDEVMAVVKRCFEVMSKDCGRISCSLKFDWRRGRSGRLRAKVESVEQKVGRSLKKARG
ncbi:MAG: MTH1187 family thiamine-binding protein [Myxococcales bacterium]|nr:MTH1187 family thiamine-binding protein [Myxococcales bacterium]